MQFYLPEQTVPEDAHMVLLAGGHPKKSSTIWKEVVIYKDSKAFKSIQWRHLFQAVKPKKGSQLLRRLRDRSVRSKEVSGIGDVASRIDLIEPF